MRIFIPHPTFGSAFPMKYELSADYDAMQLDDEGEAFRVSSGLRTTEAGSSHSSSTMKLGPFLWAWVVHSIVSVGSELFARDLPWLFFPSFFRASLIAGYSSRDLLNS